MKKQQGGFTLIELMIVVAIISILAATAIPQYIDYTQGSKLSGGIAGIVTYKNSVAMCFQVNAELDDCNHGESGIPDEILAGDDGATINYVDAIDVALGVITVTTTGIATDDSLLWVEFDPTVSAGDGDAALNWVLAGNGCTDTGRSIRCDGN